MIRATTKRDPRFSGLHLALFSALTGCSTGPIIMVPSFDASSSKHDTPAGLAAPESTRESPTPARDGGADVIAE
jgi:hypothetical protein